MNGRVREGILYLFQGRERMRGGSMLNCKMDFEDMMRVNGLGIRRCGVTVGESNVALVLE